MTLIEVTGLRKSYDGTEVLHGIDLSVADGEIVGIVGPNGAGKTTTVECIGGLRRRDAGEIRVAGLDPGSGDPTLREVLGMQLQQCRLPGRITAGEALDLFAAFYDRPRPTAELLEQFGLSTAADRRFEHLSGGQQQRLSVALALVGRPRIAILDELTTGLDPAARRDIWTFLENLAEEGTTIMLVTHSMEEAQYLCDRIVIIDAGRVVATGSPAQLTAGTQTQRLTFRASTGDDLSWLRALPGVRRVTQDGERLVVDGDDAAPQTVLTALLEQGITVSDLRVTGPSLDDAYLAATGRASGAAPTGRASGGKQLATADKEN